jgi:hypothetical protein
MGGSCAPSNQQGIQQMDGAALVAALADRPVLGRVLREDLICSKLGSKLSTQLKDVLSICGGGLPAWCRLLVNIAKHLFPFEVRRRYFNCTAFGLGRALQHMQALNAAEVSEENSTPVCGGVGGQKFIHGILGWAVVTGCPSHAQYTLAFVSLVNITQSPLSNQFDCNQRLVFNTVLC